MEDFVVVMIFAAVLVVFIVSGRKRAARQKNRAAAEKAAPRAPAYDVVMTWEGLVMLDAVEEQGTISFYEGRDLYPPKEGQRLWYKGRWTKVVSVQSGPRKDYLEKTYVGVQKLVLSELEHSTPTL